jgi:putative ABC transport system permease protein
MTSLIRHSWRSWKSAKGVALLAAVALAVGIGSTTAIYTVIHAVLLKPLPYQHPERWVSLFGAQVNDPGHYSSLSHPDLLEYQRRTRVFDVFGWYKPTDFSLTSPGQPQRIRGAEVMPSLAGGLGVNPSLGRWFHDAAGEQNGLFLAVISDALWRRLGADASMLGKTITLNDRVYTVLGVMPPWFRLPIGEVYLDESRPDVWVPLNPQGDELSRNNAYYFCYARIKPGVTLAQAEQDAKRVAAELAREFHAPGYTARLTPILQVLNEEIRPPLLLLLGAAVVLLLITCANVAGLLLARSVARARETAVRVALGAGRGRLALEYFAEGLVVSLAGAAGGVLLSFWLVRVVLSLAAGEIPRSDEIAVDRTALAFALGSAILSSVIFSLAPLWQAVRTSPNEVLSDGARASAGARSRRLSRFLVVAQIALAFTLLAASALLLAQLGILLRVRPGFDPDHLLTFRLSAPGARYRDLAQLVPYQLRLTQALQSIPGVNGADLVNQLPLAGCCYSTSMFPDGNSANPIAQERLSILPITPGYFQTMRIPLIKGRVLNRRDTGAGVIPIVINQAAAKHYWPDRDPLGANAHLGGERGARAAVVGVVGDVRNDGLNKATVAEVYLPNSVTRVDPMAFVVRSQLPPEILMAEVRHAVQSVEAEQPVYAMQMMTGVVQGSVARQRLQSFIVSFFSVAALLMAMLGVYGVVSYSVRQRTVELGTRMAIGATSRDLLRLVVGDGLKMAAYGIGIGGGAVLAAAWLLSAQVFGIHIDDPRPFLFSTAAVAGLTAIACFFPAWRATLLSPMVAIRNEPGSTWRSARLRFLRAARQVVDSGSEDEQEVTSEAELLAEIAETGRRANSFAEASSSALECVRQRIGAVSFALFVQRAAGQPYRSEPRASASDPGETEWTLPADALIVRRLRNYTGAMPLEETDFDAMERWARDNAPVHLAEISVLRQIGAALVARVAVKHEISGLLLAGHPIGRGAYSALDKRLLRGVSAQFAMMIENSRLTDRIVEQERLRRELLLAAEVQMRLFPENSPDTASLQLFGVCLPARGVGGDYYDFLHLDDGRIGIALADVAGKGIAAALIMSVVQASLRSLAGSDGASLAELAAKMNRLLYRSTGPSSYATFFYAEVDEDRRQLRYVNAGHNPPFLLRNGQAAPIEQLSTGGTIIGMFPQSSYEEGIVDLRAGDLLVAFTDGVPDALNPADEEFGEERLKEALVRLSDLPVGEMSSRLLQELKLWISDAAQYDDLTFVLMKVRNGL